MQTTEKPKTQSLRTRRFIARYVKYLEIFGYGFVFTVVTIIAFLWFSTTEDLVLSGAEPIKPHEYVLSPDEDIIVIEALVKNKTDVIVGQPLFEISRDKSQVSSYRVKQVAEELSGELDSLATSSSLTSAERDLQGVLRSSASIWEQELPRRETLTATHPGVILFEEEIVGTVVPKGDEIARILDFDDLRISADLKGAGQKLVRFGQPAHIEVITTYGDGEILRTGVDSPDSWGMGFAQFNDISDGQITKQLEKYFSGKLVAIEDDTVFALGKVKIGRSPQRSERAKCRAIRSKRKDRSRAIKPDSANRHSHRRHPQRGIQDSHFTRRDSTGNPEYASETHFGTAIRHGRTALICAGNHRSEYDYRDGCR